MIAIILFTAITAEGQERFLTDEIGRRVKIPDSPRRIVSLAPSITEILFALDINEEIVGITSFCDYPKAALSKPKIGGFVNPSIEKIVSLKPDLVIGIGEGNRRETIYRLGNLGLSVYCVNPKGFDGVMRTIQNIGEIVGRQDESEKIIRNMFGKMERIVTLTKPLPRPLVFFQVGYDPIVTVGRGTLGDDLIRLAGGRSISENESMNYPLYSIETIISKAPEIIISSSMGRKRNYLNLVKKWQNWKTIPAVKRKAIYVVNSNLVDRPTPRIIEGLEAMVRMINPEIFGEKQ
ncbi:MAG: cobalamin-binding protein [Deltaproteobacteria bacterium]|nr:cobalamin-binding protein [Deltaproteobacteria bacterium]